MHAATTISPVKFEQLIDRFLQRRRATGSPSQTQHGSIFWQRRMTDDSFFAPVPILMGWWPFCGDRGTYHPPSWREGAEEEDPDRAPRQAMSMEGNGRDDDAPLGARSSAPHVVIYVTYSVAYELPVVDFLAFDVIRAANDANNHANDATGGREQTLRPIFDPDVARQLVRRLTLGNAAAEEEVPSSDGDEDGSTISQSRPPGESDTFIVSPTFNEVLHQAVMSIHPCDYAQLLTILGSKNVVVGEPNRPAATIGLQLSADEQTLLEQILALSLPAIGITASP